jgi:hypothetical protein
MCTVLLPAGDNPIVVNKYIVLYSPYHTILHDRHVDFHLRAIEVWRFVVLQWYTRTEFSSDILVPSFTKIGHGMLFVYANREQVHFSRL